MGTAKKTTMEDVWKLIKENSLQIKGLHQSQEKTDQAIEETARQLQETAQQLKETDRRFNTQWGKLVESLVKGDIVRQFSQWGIEVQGTTERAKKLFKGKQYEFDIIAHNGEEIIVVEVKTTLNVKEVNHFIEKLKCFKEIFPEYADKKIYGAVAYIVADARSDKYSENKKLFVIRATGNSSTITNDKDFRPRIF